MSQVPPNYERSYSFTDFSINTPNLQQPGNKIDQELNNARTSLNATIARLSEIQYDDGSLKISQINVDAIAAAASAPAQAAAAAAEVSRLQAQAARNDTYTSAAEIDASKTYIVNVVNQANASVASGVAAVNAVIPVVTAQAEIAAAAASEASGYVADATTQANAAEVYANQAGDYAGEAAASAAAAATSAESAPAVPTGGSAGQVLSKIDSTNYNTQWVDASSGGTADALPLAGGTMAAGAVIDFASTSGKDSEVGAWGFGVEDSNGSYTTVEPTLIKTLTPPSGEDNGSLTNITPGNITAGGDIADGNPLNYTSLGGGSISFRTDDGPYYFSIGTGGITFSDGTTQTTAATGGGGSGSIADEYLSFTGVGFTYHNIDDEQLKLNLQTVASDWYGINSTANWDEGLKTYLIYVQPEAYGGSVDKFEVIKDHGIKYKEYNKYLDFTPASITGSANAANSTSEFWSLSQGGVIGYEWYLNANAVSGGNWSFPPAGGTTSQYIDGTGGLQTFPSVTSVGKMVTAVYNNSGATIPKGSVVYINGKHGQEPTIALAKADAESTSAYTIGVTEASIANNSSGNIVTAGTIENIATNAYSDGTPLYLSATTAGGLTATKQFAPNHYVKIGTVINANPTTGTIFIKVENGYQLDELSDCAVTAPANNNVLTYESSTSLWKDKSVSTALGYAPANQTLSNLTSASTARTNLGLAYATDAQVIAGTSASTVITPSLATSNFLNWTVCGTSGLATATSVGTVSTSSYGSRCSLTATTAGQYAIVYPANGSISAFTTSGTAYTDCNFSKRIKVYGRVYVSPQANLNCYYAWGRSNNTPSTIGSPAAKGFGIRIQGTGAVELQVHNGTTLSNVTSSFTPTTTTTFDCLIDSIGDGNVNLYINGSLVATSSGGPTGTGSAGFPLLIQEISSTASSSAGAFYVTGKAIYMA